MSDPVADAVSRAIGVHVIPGSGTPVAGGSIHRTLSYRTRDGAIFLKLGPHSVRSMFEAEADGLRALSRIRELCVPRVLASGEMDERVFLCLEWLELVAPTSSVAAKLGETLAALHRCVEGEHGWNRDNYIGRTPQINRRDDEWVRFFRERRLLPQLELARANHADRRTFERGLQLAHSLDALFKGYRPAPSVLHGDLWGGNWGATRGGVPALFDPAVYCGDRETDIAMTRLFGGFDPAFYAAYEATWPLDPGASSRVTLYNLYHVLNHFNLFGGGYLAQARAMIDESLAMMGH